MWYLKLQCRCNSGILLFIRDCWVLLVEGRSHPVVTFPNCFWAAQAPRCAWSLKCPFHCPQANQGPDKDFLKQRGQGLVLAGNALQPSGVEAVMNFYANPSRFESSDQLSKSMIPILGEQIPYFPPYLQLAAPRTG